MRQEITRAHQGWALDNVTMHNEVTRLSTEEARAPPNVINFLRLKETRKNCDVKYSVKSRGGKK